MPLFSVQDALKLLLALGVAVLLGLWLRYRATPDSAVAVLGALHQATPAEVESITVYPLLPARPGGEARPFQLRGAGVRALLPGLRQLRPLAVDTTTFQPLLEATVVVKLKRSLVAAWHLHGRDVVLRLATAPEGAVALRAQSRVVYQSTLLSQRVQQVRDSLGGSQ